MIRFAAFRKELDRLRAECEYVADQLVAAHAARDLARSQRDSLADALARVAAEAEGGDA